MAITSSMLDVSECTSKVDDVQKFYQAGDVDKYKWLDHFYSKSNTLKPDETYMTVINNTRKPILEGS